MDFVLYEWQDEKLFVYVHIYETYLAQIKIGSAFKNIHLMIFSKDFSSSFSGQKVLVNRIFDDGEKHICHNSYRKQHSAGQNN